MNKNLLTLFKSIICGSLFQLAFSVLLVDWLPLQKFGYSFYEVSFKFLPALLLIAIYFIFLAVALFSKRVRSKAINLFGCTVGIFLTIVPASSIGQELRMNEFHKLADRSEHLIVAINSFKQDNGELPNDLQQLIPKYLDKYPTTKMAAYPNYNYSKSKNGESFSLIVECGIGILNWDEFIYQSNEDYSGFSSSAERVGKWLYFYE
jgi:hypothetical protein